MNVPFKVFKVLTILSLVLGVLYNLAAYSYVVGIYIDWSIASKVLRMPPIMEAFVYIGYSGLTIWMLISQTKKVTIFEWLLFVLAFVLGLMLVWEYVALM